MCTVMVDKIDYFGWYLFKYETSHKVLGKGDFMLLILILFITPKKTNLKESTNKWLFTMQDWNP